MRDDKQLAAIDRELATMRLDRGDVIEAVLPAVREVLDLETLLVMTPVEHPAGGLTLARFHASGFGDDGRRLHRRFAQFFRGAPRRYAWYDPICPEPEQRNRLLDALDLMPRAELEASTIYREVLEPLGLHRYRQPRILLCDGSSLLAWFGGFSDEKPTVRQRRLLRRIAPRLRERLAVERRLADAPRSFAALGACMERLGAPAFVLGSTGAITDVNDAGRTLLETRGREVREALRDRVRGRAATLGIELVRLGDRGAPAGWLAIVTPWSEETQLAAAIQRAARRWALTTRQREVLAHVVRGTPNATIAAALRVSVRAIELHVTRLLDRAGVDSRAALAARVLLVP